MRKPLIVIGMCIATVMVAALLGCSTTPPILVAALSPEGQRVAQALEKWPGASTGGPGMKREFFTTIHVAERRTTASGILDYHNPRDFRVTAVTELGVVLFDARVNWAGVTVLREMPGLEKSIVMLLVRDLSRAMVLPMSLNGLAEKNGQLLLKQTEAGTFGYLWIFDAKTGLLLHSEVDIGTFDKLRVDYLHYNTRGWPTEISMTRKARFYNIAFTFTDDDNLVSQNQRDNAR